MRREKARYLEYLEHPKDARNLWKGIKSWSICSFSSSSGDLPYTLRSQTEINSFFKCLKKKQLVEQNSVLFEQ